MPWKKTFFYVSAELVEPLPFQFSFLWVWCCGFVMRALRGQSRNMNSVLSIVISIDASRCYTNMPNVCELGITVRFVKDGQILLVTVGRSGGISKNRRLGRILA